MVEGDAMGVRLVPKAGISDTVDLSVNYLIYNHGNSNSIVN